MLGLTVSKRSKTNFWRAGIVTGFFSLWCFFGTAVPAVEASPTDGTIDATYRYAWGENIGWVDFGSSTDAVHVTASALTGSAYGENIGWLVLDPEGYGGVTNDGEGNLAGEAWGENIGWVDFSQVTIGTDGVFAGQAYGENIGWITFGTTTNKVVTDWRASSGGQIFTISGVLYESDRTTPQVATTTVTLALVATTTLATYSTTTELTTGAFAFNIDIGELVSTSTPVTLYVNGNTSIKAVTVTKTNGSSTITNLDLYQNHVIISHEATSGTSTTNTDLAQYDTDNDSDIPFTANSGTLAIQRGYELFIKPGKTFAPGGPVSASSSLTIASGATYDAPATTTINGTFSNQGTFTENGGTLTMDGIYTDVLNYVAGSDVSGDSSGTSVENVFALTTSGQYLYLGKDADATACSQTAGSAIGCELMVFDISSSTNPVYVAGRDASGDSGGTGLVGIRSLITVGDYLYLGKNADATACSQTAGLATGCELMVFDIASSTNPVYVAGRDASGDSGGTGVEITYALTTSGQYLYLGKDADATACSQTAGSAIGCELMVFDISSTTNPVYVAGRDASGDSGGTGSKTIYALTTSGQYLYLGKLNDATACSQTAGSAIGCELMVFDISSTTNPVYVAGRDASGDSGGTGSVSIYSFTTYGDYLYLGKNFNITACSQTAGSAIGCELMVFDISSSTNPVYVAGRDVSGDSSGIKGQLAIYAITTSGYHLIIGKTNGTRDSSEVPCSQTAGSAIGCDLMTFDISSTTNPIYVAGRDVSGDSSGTGSKTIYALTTSGQYLYLGKQNDATACSQTAGSAIGCELMVFNANPADGAVLLGTLTAESALGDTVAQGTVRFIDTASTTNLTINSGATVVAPATVLSIAGNYTNNGTFTHNSGTTTLSGTSAQTATGTMTGTSAFNHLSLTGAGVKTFGTNASTSNFVVNSGATAVAPAELSVSGHYLNNGTTTMAGATWTDRNVTSAKAWTSVTYGNGLFVAVNNNSSATAAVMTSPDGITWTDRNVPSAKSWISVTYGNGLFVAVNYDGSATAAVMTSPDGITWTDRNVPSAKGWISVTYGNGLFVAVNGDGSATAAVMTSPDGITWTDRNVPSAKSWRSVTYGNGLFVAVNGNNSATAAVMTSSDGITWTDRNVPSAKALESVTYGNGLFVAVCVYNEFYLESDSLMTSPDGIIWTERNVPSAKYWIGVTYGNGLFVALNNDGSATSAVMTSPDGITWTDRNVPSAKQWTSVTYGNGRFMAVNGDVSATAAVMTSDVSTITFTGASAQSIGGSLTGASALGNVAFTGAGIKTFGANASTTNFVVNSGATAVAPASLTIAGDYQNNGTFTAGSGTTTFIGGTAQVATGTMTGTSAFNNLDIRNTHTSTSTTFGNNVTVSGNLTNNILGSKLAFAPGITATTTTLTITGSSTATTSLRSTTVGSQFNLAVTGSYNLSYIEVQDSNACRSVGGEIDVIGDNVTDSGNNTCWKFVIDPNDFLTVSGVLYETNRTTPQVATTTVTLALIATSTLATFSTTTELTTGAFAFNIEIGQLVATSTPVTLYVNGNASIKAVTVTKTSGTTTIANLDLYQNHVIVSHEATSGTSTTNTDLAQYDTDNDSDVPFTANSGTLAIQRGYELFIKPGKTFAPGGPVSASSSLTIASGATYDAPAATTTINGTLSNQGTFTENGGTLTMDGIYTDVLSYLAGRDVSGDSSGTGLEFIYALTTAGNYLYLGKSSDATACSQTAGSAIGCELMVFDISSSSNPVYVAGRDVSGDSSGTGSLTVYSLTTLGNYLYVGKSSNATACSQTAGSAIGCELMVFDISSTTNPIYVAGRDASGDSGGTGSANIYSLITAGNYLYLGKQGNVTACSQTAGSAIGCELMVFDISSTTNPVYVAGRDASGDSGGTDAEHNLALTISGQYLYLGKDPNITACSQTAGSAIGCELMVFDISSTTNPVYVAGRDVSGDSGGTGSGYIYALTTAGNYLYVGKSNSATACSQTAGSAIGCELMVFDISSSSNPVYVAGRDVSGDSGGTGSGYIYALTTAGHYLYLGKNGISTACSQTAGSAIGCELMVFDISSSSNPVYVAGRDVSGNSDLGKKNIYALTIAGDYLYVGKQSDATACSQTAGSATGCELMVFNANPADGGVVLGTLTAESALGDTVTQGNVRFIDTSSTTNLTIVSGTTTLTSSITVSGNLYNQATLEALVDSTQYYAGNYTNTGTIMAGGTIQVFASDSTQTLVGTLNGTSAFSNLTFTGSGAKTVSAAASTTGTFTIESGASVTADEPLSVAGVFANAGTFNAPATLTVHDNYTNTGTFDANSGVIELKTYITNYLQGRDVSGDSGGTGAQNIIALTTVGNYLYVGKQGDATACSQVVGSASGCELMVFDISSTTNPLYVAGRDASGDSGGTGSLTVYSLTTLGNYLYLGKEGSSATACEQTAGSAIGCELMVFDISSSSNPVYVAGRDVSGDSGGTAEYVAIYSLTTVGNYLYVGKQGDATACSQVVGSASGCELMVFDISSVPATPSTSPVATPPVIVVVLARSPSTPSLLWATTSMWGRMPMPPPARKPPAPPLAAS